MKPSIRFRVFEKANFTCAYCGRKPPAVTLEVDHIEPLSKGGTDSPSNLLCSCKDCNRGKGKHRLHEAIPNAVSQNAEDTKERLAQMKRMLKQERAIAACKELRIDEIERRFAECWEWEPGTSLKPHLRRSFGMLIDILGSAAVLSAADNALSKQASGYLGRAQEMDVLRYCFGICWKQVREQGK